MSTNKSFTPQTFIEWLTVTTLIIGIMATVYGSIVKPYRYILDAERRLTSIEYQLVETKKQVEKMFDIIIRQKK